jgi:hypothetical protein
VYDTLILALAVVGFITLLFVSMARFMRGLGE